MVRTQLPWGQRGPLRVNSPTPKEAPLFLILLLPILVPLFLLGWTLYYWGGRK